MGERLPKQRFLICRSKEIPLFRIPVLFCLIPRLLSDVGRLEIPPFPGISLIRCSGVLTDDKQQKLEIAG
uniref:Uncharacterized protein n=1 Tax=Heterorhabditis bacteriophora TaxID=37862 RepID=A0A1I7X516_HETBA